MSASASTASTRRMRGVKSRLRGVGHVLSQNSNAPIKIGLRNQRNELLLGARAAAMRESTRVAPAVISQLENPKLLDQERGRRRSWFGRFLRAAAVSGRGLGRRPRRRVKPQRVARKVAPSPLSFCLHRRGWPTCSSTGARADRSHRRRRPLMDISRQAEEGGNIRARRSPQIFRSQVRTVRIGGAGNVCHIGVVILLLFLFELPTAGVIGGCAARR